MITSSTNMFKQVFICLDMSGQYTALKIMIHVPNNEEHAASYSNYAIANWKNGLTKSRNQPIYAYFYLLCHAAVLKN